MWTRLLLAGIVMCCAMDLTGCAKQNPYLREIRPSYDEAGQPLPGYATLPIPYLEHMLKDLDACYAQER